MSQPRPGLHASAASSPSRCGVCLGISARPRPSERALDLLARVGIPDPERTFAAYPHQISGGMAQRVLIAGAVSCDPDLLIADEPTTALDVTVQAEVLDLLRDLQAEFHMGVLLVTHNFGVVADLCDRVSVMRAGRIVETGPGAGDLRRPAARVHPSRCSTRSSRTASPRRRARVRRTAEDAAPHEHARHRSDPHDRAACSTSTSSSSSTPGKGFRQAAVPGAARRLPRHPPRRDRRPGRRVRLGQDHARPRRARPGPGHRRRDPLRRPRHQPPARARSGARCRATSRWSSRTPTPR